MIMSDQYGSYIGCGSNSYQFSRFSGRIYNYTLPSLRTHNNISIVIVWATLDFIYLEIAICNMRCH